MGWLIGLVVWIGCAVAASAILDGRGHSGALGFVLGLVFGPLGVLFALLTAPDTATIERRQVKTGTLDLCPFCSEAIKPEANVCKHCGRDVPYHTRPSGESWLMRKILDRFDTKKAPPTGP